jgi:hypothetical protein
MLFLFDYGDEWHFRVRLRELGTKAAKARYPRVVTIRGVAPPQYAYPEDDDRDDGDRATEGISLLTGEKIIFRR